MKVEHITLPETNLMNSYHTLQDLETKNIQNYEDAMMIKKSLLQVLKDLVLEYRFLRMDQRNKEINKQMPTILSLLARVQGTDIICNVGEEEGAVKVLDPYIDTVDVSNDNALDTLRLLYQEFMNHPTLLQTSSFSSHADVILVKKK